MVNVVVYLAGIPRGLERGEAVVYLAGIPRGLERGERCCLSGWRATKS